MMLECCSAPHLLGLEKTEQITMCLTRSELSHPPPLILGAPTVRELPLSSSSINPGHKLLLEGSSASPVMCVLTTQLLLLFGMPGPA